MDAAATLSDDGPDPQLARWERARRFPVPIVTLEPQPALRVVGPPDARWTDDPRGFGEIAFALSYALSRGESIVSLPDAVRSVWSREPLDLQQRLISHVDDVRRHRARRSVASAGAPLSPEGTRSTVQLGVPVLLDDVEERGARIDGDSHVYAVGAYLGDYGMFTAVVPRDDLPFLRLAFVSQPVAAFDPSA